MTFSWDFDYPSQRMPVLAQNVVATSQPLAAQAGLRMLLKGGNAVDAALAVAIALTVVEPTSNGIGSDAFALVWDRETLYGLNGSGRSPRSWTYQRFSGFSEMPSSGWDTVTVPGAVDAWVRLSQRWGKLPFADLFEPAIRYARNGYPVSPITALRWEEAIGFYPGFPEINRVFFPLGRAPLPGEIFSCTQQAETLVTIAKSYGESFYRGRLARKISACSAAQGGAMMLSDLEQHRSDWVEPISIDFQGVRLHEIPPNGQGIAALIALGILRHVDLKRYSVDSVDSIHLQIEAMKSAFTEVFRNVADPDHMKLEPSDLLQDDFLTSKAKTIRLEKASEPQPQPTVSGGTVYLTAADASGMMVSFIQSNYMGFGSGISIEGTGITMQNRGCGFVLEKDHPNAVGGGKRPFHTIIPGFVTKNGQPVMSLGVMGAHMQPQGHVQMMVRIFAYGQNPQTACDAPRWHVAADSSIDLEQGFPKKVIDGLIQKGHSVRTDAPTSLFGGGQFIYRMESGGYFAASDPRKDGQAVGF
jgi:gamma-glutamyltranspeptidase/glutathione hydrolase